MDTSISGDVVKKIIFTPENAESEHWTLPPVPAISQMPDWYKKMSKYMEEEKSAITLLVNKNLTVKSCIPFMDSMTSGYLILLSSDVLIKQLDDSPYFKWTSEEQMVFSHSDKQITEVSVPEGMYQGPFKWRNFHEITTPKGWSSLITHPMNRSDLPFITIPGIVDTDKFDLIINFPFFVSSSFEGILKRGTPIAQITPIKREHWKSEIRKSMNDHDKRLKKLHAYFEKYYRKTAWSRKIYE